ncbi:hypothetical protein [Plantactinospora sp. KBS50]|uniref:hypothetical protein n=1 Tax=Plantactinospora sp. KBS50 TaxID=2024580 RepID=UPI000BAAB981|nr:hypothetical protein [Plantactinospora sp. KBS50]ASW53900.1 hypothetical protein CIK06_06465 [Plantactinospora sp. KBS50]
MSGPLRRLATNLVAWLLGAVVSVTVGVLALTRVDEGLANGVQPLSPDSVTRGLPDPPSAAPSRTPRRGATSAPARSPSRRATSAPGRPAPSEPSVPATPPAPRAVERTFTAQGGSLLVRCTAGLVYLASWSPAPATGCWT